MVRTTGKDKLDNSEEAISPRLVFSDDASVVDYLYDLMASAPAINPESGEIKFVHLPAWARQEQADAAGTFVDKSLFFGTERSKIEVEGLRSENRDLKFKTELADINAQVLRSENDSLKVKLADLAAQRDEIKYSLDAVTRKNNDLMLKVDCLQTQLDLSEKNVFDISQQLAFERLPRESVMVTEKENNQEQEATAIEDTRDAAAPDQEEESLPQFTVPQEAAPDKITEIEPAPATSLDVEHVEPYQRVKSPSGIDPDTAFLSRAHAVNIKLDHHINGDAAVFSRKTFVSAPIAQSAKPASKIIKQQQGKEKQLSHKIDLTMTILPQDSSPYTRTTREAELKPPSVQPQQITEPQSNGTDGVPTDKNLLHCDTIDGVEQEASPAPRIIVRRNVKNYEDLQNETDPDKRVKAGHAIIL